MEKTLLLGKIEGRRRRGRLRMRWLESITDSMDTNLSKFLETVEDRGAWHAIVCEQEISKTRKMDKQAETVMEDKRRVRDQILGDSHCLIYLCCCCFC